MAAGKIIIRGAKAHNLKNIDVEIPRDRLVVITGLSGSGKSSLAFDTIYAEGQRRYVESLSAYARQFLEQMEKPDVELIEGLSPAISIDQRTVIKNPRSTVGTVTEIYDYLRLLFTHIGKPFCYRCGKEISSQTIQQIADQILALSHGERVALLAPMVRGKKGEYRRELENLRRDGFVRAKIDGEIRDLSEEIRLDRNKRHDIDVVIDRMIIKEGIQSRLTDSLELATTLADGIIKVSIGDSEEIIFSQRFACIDCGASYPEITPRMFSFNSPYGACPTCSGLGMKMHFDPDLIVPDKNVSVLEGAMLPWRKGIPASLRRLAKAKGVDLSLPFGGLPEEIQRSFLHGEDGVEGAIPELERKYQEVQGEEFRQEMERYMSSFPCPTCGGARLRKEALSIKVDGMSLADIVKLSVKDLLRYFESIALNTRDMEIARGILKEVTERLRFMVNVGLDYISLDRPLTTLSGGEAQRIRLATQIGSSLVGVLYILDEPSIGLHQRDNIRLLNTLKELRDLGNTVIVVEHDEETIRRADYVIDMGPGAGINGGRVIYSGTPRELLDSQESTTGKYLSGDLSIPIPKRRRNASGKFLVIKGARANNLKNIEVEIPIGLFTCVTGVSGSGKSTLVIDTLYRTLAQKLYHSRERAGSLEGIEGLEHVDKVINIDQMPIGRTPRSNPATYTGVFTFIRGLFAQLPASRMRGYKPGRFSFNVAGGRCESCKGDGIIKIEMHFLPDVYVTCEVCGGKRYNRETLEIRYRGETIADVLDMTVDQAYGFFENIPTIKGKLQALCDVGLGYIKLGQSATTLSGGEAQRIKLTRELSKRSTGKTVYFLDEPTTGLHFADIQKLLDVLNRLTDSGNTVIVIEHNMEVIKSADHIIDLGPEGGEQGGEIIAQGKPEEIIHIPTSYTGQYLKRSFKKAQLIH
ncbi:MAG: excinuclease ABC subunit UvrA [Proteobacteria bacterium]|nr:excinuclease ABC subunit UvrA [Pseudomonadota bacterium]